VVKKILSVFLLLVIVSPAPVFAYNQKEVLGVTDTAIPQVPATNEGPGLLLPDSPIFFLDQFKQTVRVAFAFTPEEKARVYANIAGERMAELRFMIAKENKAGIDIDLHGIADNLQKAGTALSQAKLSGHNVTTLAEEINTTIKQDQQGLDVLVGSDNLEIKFKAKAAEAGLLSAKVQVEDALPQDEQNKEISEDIKRAMQTEMAEAALTTKQLEQQYTVLGAMAPASATATSQAVLKH